MKSLAKSLVFAPGIAVVALAHTALAADACSAAYEHAQERRADGDLIQAREQLLACNKPECADFIRQDCGQWLGEVETALPSVSVEATDAQGHVLTQVRVTVDGAPIASELNGIALPVNPGNRHFEFEVAGFPALERDVFLAEGQKSQLVEIKFELPPPVQVPAKPSAEPVTARHVSPAVYAFGTLGVLGIAGFAAFGASGVNDEHRLRAEPCAQSSTCSDAQVSPIERKYVIADISLSVGVLSLGTAAYFLFARREPAAASSTPGAPHLGMSVGPGSAFATVFGCY